VTFSLQGSEGEGRSLSEQGSDQDLARVDGECQPDQPLTAPINGTTPATAPLVAVQQPMDRLLDVIRSLAAQRADLIDRIAIIDAQLADVGRALAGSASGGFVDKRRVAVRVLSTDRAVARLRRKSQERADKGLCRKCDAPAVFNRNGSRASLCEKHRDLNRAFALRYHERKRVAVEAHS
jgi:hypothetical protein